MGELRFEVGGKQFVVRDPGPRWVLEAQESCIGPGGRLSPIQYVERILNELVIEPKNATVDIFAHEDEIVEFLRKFTDLRRRKIVSEMEKPYCPVGQKNRIKVNDIEVEVVNPGVRWVLQTQEQCSDMSGRLSIVRYVERVIQDCVVGKKLSVDDFKHEDEVIEFLRLFRQMRMPPKRQAAAGAEKEDIGAVDQTAGEGAE